MYNVCVQDHHTYFLGKPAWGFSVLVHNQSEGGAQAAAKAKFTEGKGPVLIAGVLGRNLAPKVNEEFKTQITKIQEGFNNNIQQPPKGQARQTAAPKPLFYRSSDNTNDINDAGNDAAIAKSLATKILKDVADGKLKEGDVYRLLLVGYRLGRRQGD